MKLPSSQSETYVINSTFLLLFTLYIFYDLGTFPTYPSWIKKDLILWGIYLFFHKIFLQIVVEDSLRFVGKYGKVSLVTRYADET